ncbi:hypothetical protein MKQ70_10740 [Chitinophaga sedimenti]|uniref:hypothetical protein n=1 Tax=Chitinophaga sedimenti TaxID=2033606 RepID=UPI002006B4BB|nr:hypothetical protein [Chitinophaga sedimenti]MCK7555455.1 hypothetical protein [Chitinophaga sedimenti]
MQDYTIIVNKIEELQTIKDVQELEMILDRARRTIIGGDNVLLVRQDRQGNESLFETITNERDFERYREQVMKYL